MRKPASNHLRYFDFRTLSAEPARIVGLTDRGRLEVGLRADVNVIDPERVAERMPEYVHDFPGGAGRFVQRAQGYRATLCNGRVILADRPKVIEAAEAAGVSIVGVPASTRP